MMPNKTSTTTSKTFVNLPRTGQLFNKIKTSVKIRGKKHDRKYLCNVKL